MHVRLSLRPICPQDSIMTTLGSSVRISAKISHFWQCHGVNCSQNSAGPFTVMFMQVSSKETWRNPSGLRSYCKFLNLQTWFYSRYLKMQAGANRNSRLRLQPAATPESATSIVSECKMRMLDRIQSRDTITASQIQPPCCLLSWESFIYSFHSIS